MNKIFKGLIRFLIEVIVMTVLIVGINIFTNGMYLWGLPRINDIQSVNITYPSVTDDVKEISSSEDIELALKLTGFLKYDLFGEVNSEEEPAITITYFLKDPCSRLKIPCMPFSLAETYAPPSIVSWASRLLKMPNFVFLSTVT